MPPPPAGPTLNSIFFRPTTSSTWDTRGGTDQTIAFGRFSDGTNRDITTSCSDWSSDNTFVLTISNAGLMTFLNSGTSTVTATCQDVYYTELIRIFVIPGTPWTRSGSGSFRQSDALPSYVERVRITGRVSGPKTALFMVFASGRLLAAPAVVSKIPYDGTHSVSRSPNQPPFGSLEVRDATNTIAWTMTEVR